MKQRFISRTVVVDAVQFTDINNPPEGVVLRLPTFQSDEVRERYIATNFVGYVRTVMGNRLTGLRDWIITEPDGVHHLPLTPELFERAYRLASPEDEARHFAKPAEPLHTLKDGTVLTGARAAQLYEDSRAFTASLQETVTRLNRRCQLAEKALPQWQKIETMKFVSGTFGRAVIVHALSQAKEDYSALEVAVQRLMKLLAQAWPGEDEGSSLEWPIHITADDSIAAELCEALNVLQKLVPKQEGA